MPDASYEQALAVVYAAAYTAEAACDGDSVLSRLRASAAVRDFAERASISRITDGPK